MSRTHYDDNKFKIKLENKFILPCIWLFIGPYKCIAGLALCGVSTVQTTAPPSHHNLT